MHYIGCSVRTIAEVEQAADPAEQIMLANMKCNGWSRVVATTGGWKWSQPLNTEDVVLDAEGRPV